MKRYIKTYFTCGLLLVGLLSACKEEDMTLGEGSVRRRGGCRFPCYRPGHIRLHANPHIQQ